MKITQKLGNMFKTSMISEKRRSIVVIVWVMYMAMMKYILVVKKNYIDNSKYLKHSDYCGDC